MGERGNYQLQLNIYCERPIYAHRSAVRDRERYIEDKTGASQLKESEFVCFYASENTRSKVGEPLFLSQIRS